MAMTPEESERLNQIFEAAMRHASGIYTPSDGSIGSVSSEESIDKYFPSAMSVQSRATAPSAGILKTLGSFQDKQIPIFGALQNGFKQNEATDGARSKAYIAQNQESGAKGTGSQTSTDSMATAPLLIYITPVDDQMNFDKEKSSDTETEWQLGYIAVNKEATNVELSGPCEGRKTYSGYFIPISPKLPDPVLKIVDNLKKSSIKNILDIEETCVEINKKIAFEMIMANKAKLHYADDDAVLKAFKEQFVEKIKSEVSKRKLKKREIKRVNEVIADKLGEEYVIAINDMKSRFRNFMRRVFPCFYSSDTD